MMREMTGECLTCSIGIASNKLLGKLASDMQKPDGLTILSPTDLPHAILHLSPQDISGIGPNMAQRLYLAGLRTMNDLWNADATTLRRVWGGITGARFHALLHGADLPSPSRPRRSLGHQHVLAPSERSMLQAWVVLRQLLSRAALRLRNEGFYCRRLILDVKWAGHMGYCVEETKFSETQDTNVLLRHLMNLWPHVPHMTPLRVGVTLADLVENTKHQLDLFEKRQNADLSRAVDFLNERFGRGTIGFGPQGGPKTAKIAFSRVPGRDEV
jgi:DNA polymerase-4